MVHFWPAFTNDEPSGGPHLVFILLYVLIGVMVVLQVFYMFYLNTTHKNLRRLLVKKGRLLKIVPLVTVSTVTEQGTSQPSAPAHVRTDSEGSAVSYSKKASPPSYAP
ncbi:unnamed protein product [Phyllotreta striolata]|uniref:Uncharacterized protein n=1 Tax=Phyllotreta striolata TaxID=444603 RepID=A0A9N9XMK2_PHYSR|nr:unnamed protein product [Phyllotreta striolata]